MYTIGWLLYFLLFQPFAAGSSSLAGLQQTAGTPKTIGAKRRFDDACADTRTRGTIGESLSQLNVCCVLLLDCELW
jgi:hypothetical protein